MEAKGALVLAGVLAALLLANASSKSAPPASGGQGSQPCGCRT